MFLEIGLWEKAETMGGNNFNKLKGNPTAVSGTLLKNAERRLGHRCGNRFRDIVVRCITGDFGIDPQSDDRMDSQLQVRFREDVVKVLQGMWEAV